MDASWAMRPLPTFFFLWVLFLLSSFPGLMPGMAVMTHHAGGQLESGRGGGGLAAAKQAAGICASVVIPHGYECDEFDVATDDGYILSMQRIPGSRRGEAASGPVLLQHGVLMDGLTWLMGSPEESLAYVLADRGFDVWIVNGRGTRWSRRHRTLDPSSAAFWDWSWDELAKFDLTATVDFVFENSGKKLDYVAHSMGTLIALASFSEGRLVEKLRSAALLCPIAYLHHMTTPLGIVAGKIFLDEIYTSLGIAEFDPMGKAAERLLKVACRDPRVTCFDLLTSFTGKNFCLNESTVEFFLKYEPQPTSSRNMAHLAQTFRGEGAVAKFDFGSREANMAHYGQEEPPRYNMSAIAGDLPMLLSYGGRDDLADVQDVELLLGDLKLLHDSPDKLAVQFVGDFAHADFVMGVCAASVVYTELIAFFDRQNQCLVISR